MLNGWPNEVHLLTERAIGGRSDPGIRRPALGLNSYDVATIDGLLVTTIERTVVDLAETLDRESAVAVVDFYWRDLDCVGGVRRPGQILQPRVPGQTRTGAGAL